MRHRRLIKYCSEVITVSDHYSRNSFLERNRYLVDHASRLIGICRGESGGTGYTIRYARSKGLELDLIQLAAHGAETFDAIFIIVLFIIHGFRMFFKGEIRRLKLFLLESPVFP